MTGRGTAPPAREPAPPGLVDRLLDAADLDGPWRVVEVASAGRTNATTTIALHDGRRVVVRVYGRSVDGPPPSDRRAKEVWLHPRLRAAGVPVPDVLAIADHEGREGALLEWLPGELLGSVAARRPSAALGEAWREAGAALRRVHDLDLGLLGAGGVAAGAIVPAAEGSRAAQVAEELAAFARRVSAAHGSVDAARVAAAAGAVRPLLASAPVRLGHGDAHPWNVLVAPDEAGRWRLRAWLDWELARPADPADDLVRATVQRFAPIGPTPDDWWEGYGERPAEVRMEAFALHLLLMRAVDRLDGLDSPETRLVWSGLSTVPARLARLEGLLSG